MPLLRDTEKRYEKIHKLLTQLDLYHHSLNNLGRKLVPQASKAPSASLGALYEESLQLSRDCSRVVHALCDNLDEKHLDFCRSALDRLNLAIHKASQAKTPTLSLVNIWRVMETIEQFFAGIAQDYDYTRVSGEAALQAIEGQESNSAELAKLFAQYAEIMATKIDIPGPTGPPFSHGVLHWRGSQLFYVEKVEDGTRWIELDPDCERDSVIEEEEAVKLAKTRTIEGYPITLRLDLKVDQVALDNYLLSQQGSEYFVSGSQIAGELKTRLGRKQRR